MAPWSLGALAISLPLLMAASALAAPPPVKNFFPAKSNPRIGQSAPVNPRAPFLLRADEVTYDQDMDIATATGNVEISQGERVLLADTVSYNRRNQLVTASGNVTLMEPSGEVVFGDYVEVDDDLKDGFINNIKVLLTDNARIAAVAGQRTEGSRKEFVRGVFSPCNLCADDPTRAPLWQMKGVRMTHDEVDREIAFEDATLELFGVPVFYWPYFSTPDPTVKRRSGLLNPNVGADRNVGGWYGQPYYGVLSENADFTVEPRYYTNEGAFIAGEYRQSFDKATLRLAGSAADSRRIEQGQAVNGTSGSWRGNVAGEGRIEFDDNWRGGFDLNRATDRTYVNKFHVNTTYRTFGRYDLPNFRTSEAFTEGFFGDSYAQVSAFAFQDNVGGSVAQQVPKALPYASYSYVSPRDNMGGYIKSDVNALVIARQQIPRRGTLGLATNSDRLANFSGYYLPVTTNRGDVVTLAGTLEADGYYVRDSFDPTTGKTFTGTTGRAHPQVAAQWRYPLVKQVETISYLIEPQADVVVGPNGDNPRRIPNEDAQAFEFDDTNLFSLRRYGGFDRLAAGQRVDYGVTGAAYGRSGGSTSAFIGQSARSHGDSSFSPNSGLQDRVSDIVGRFTVNPRKNLDLTYRYRLDHNTLQTNRDEIAAAIHVGPRSTLGVGYIHFAKPVTDVSTFPTEQIATSAFVAINDFWTLYSAYAYDLTRQESRIGRIGAVYRDECFAILISLDETFHADRDIAKGVSFLVRFGFKYLGDFGG
ncbi:MAG: LPS-assembly protein LptD [Proteobacteria bacterium]|nr:LPS-assembly protein LptD [Pseudomonadota bacterium]